MVSRFRLTSCPLSRAHPSSQWRHGSPATPFLSFPLVRSSEPPVLNRTIFILEPDPNLLCFLLSKGKLCATLLPGLPPTNPSTQGAHALRFLTIAPTQAGWAVVSGAWQVEPEHTLVNTSWCVTSHLCHLYFVLEISKVRPQDAMKELKEKDVMLTMSYKCINLYT